MRHEETSPKQHFLPFPPHAIKTTDDTKKELLMPCGRFKSVFSLKKGFLLNDFFPSTHRPNDGDLNMSLGMPLNWQHLLRYLYEKGITQKPMFTFQKSYNDYPKMYKLMLAAKFPKSTDGGESPIFGFSSGTNIEEVMGKTVGEMLERYVLTIYKRETFKRSLAQNISRKNDVLDVFLLNDFLPWQQERFPRFIRRKESHVYWVLGEKIGSGPIYIPAQLIFWNYNFKHDPLEPILANPTTNGAGGHVTREEAILSGLFELIHRDGFLIYWLNGLSPRRVDMSGVHDTRVLHMLESFKRYGVEIHFLDTTTDIGVPSLIAAIVDERGKEPIIAIGGAAGFDIASLAIHSASEALSVIDFVRDSKQYIFPENYEPFVNGNIGRIQRLTAWRGKEMLERFKFFIAGEYESPRDMVRGMTLPTSPKESLNRVHERLRSLGEGYEVCVYDAKHHLLEELGYYVVKVVVPQLVHLYLAENRATLDARRLREVPGKLGYRAAEKFNPWPHPFP